jgi:hypothetical protein
MFLLLLKNIGTQLKNIFINWNIVEHHLVLLGVAQVILKCRIEVIIVLITMTIEQLWLNSIFWLREKLVYI